MTSTRKPWDVWNMNDVEEYVLIAHNIMKRQNQIHTVDFSPCVRPTSIGMKNAARVRTANNSENWPTFSRTLSNTRPRNRNGIVKRCT
jgi:hypothetical protein